MVAIPLPSGLRPSVNIGVVKYSGDEGLMATFKWIIPAQRMVFVLDSVPTEWARQELLKHQMIGNIFSQWQGVKASLDDQRLVDMTLADFRVLFKGQFVPDTTREIIRDQFWDFYQGVNVQAYTKCFNKLDFFFSRGCCY